MIQLTATALQDISSFDALTGVVWGVFFYVFSLVIALWLYRLYSPMYQKTCSVMLIAWLGHFLAASLFSTFTFDSASQFFGGATPVFILKAGTTHLVQNIVWYVREYITGDSYLATVYFFSAAAFIGGVAWYLLFLQLAQALEVSNQRYIFPALVIMCWPSFLFFTCGYI